MAKILVKHLQAGSDGQVIQSSGGTAVWAGLTVPTWIKVTKTFSDLSFAGTSNDIEVLSLAPAGVIHAVKVKHSTLFSGGGISGYTVSIGITGNLTKYADPFDVTSAVGGTNFLLSQSMGSESHTLPASIRIAAVSTGANLSAATQGSVDVWLFVSTAA